MYVHSTYTIYSRTVACLYIQRLLVQVIAVMDTGILQVLIDACPDVNLMVLLMFTDALVSIYHYKGLHSCSSNTLPCSFLCICAVRDADMGTPNQN